MFHESKPPFAMPLNPIHHHHPPRHHHQTTGSILNSIEIGKDPRVYVVGHIGHPNAKIVRIVHISDTLGDHWTVRENIPIGHVLIHSGDFGTSFPFYKQFHKKADYQRHLYRMEHFFKQLPHPYKIFVAGDRDFPLQFLTPQQIQEHLPSVIYLHDSSCTLLGLKFYGSPWSVARKIPFTRSFRQGRSFVKRKWREIPEDVDILITHMNPWTNKSLYQHVAHNLKPTVHLFSDEEVGPGILWKQNILFCNGVIHWKCASRGSSFHRRSASSTSFRSTERRLFTLKPKSSSLDRRYVNMHSPCNGDSHPSPIVIDVYVLSQDSNYVQFPSYSLPPLPCGTLSESSNDQNPKRIRTTSFNSWRGMSLFSLFNTKRSSSGPDMTTSQGQFLSPVNEDKTEHGELSCQLQVSSSMNASIPTVLNSMETSEILIGNSLDTLATNNHTFSSSSPDNHTKSLDLLNEGSSHRLKRFPIRSFSQLSDRSRCRLS